MEELIELLTDIDDSIDYENADGLVTDGLLDSLSLVEIVVAIKEKFGVKIPGSMIVPENFDSLERIKKLIEKCEKEG